MYRVLCLMVGFSIDGFTTGQYPISPDQTQGHGRGIERIERHPIYYTYHLAAHNGWASQGFGVYNVGQMCGNHHSVAGRCHTDQYPITAGAFGGSRARTITNDIRVAIMDETLFQTLLFESNFKGAYDMAIDNEQGNLWKRQVIASTKNSLEKYIRRSILEQDDEASLKSLEILESFKDLPEPYAVLSSHFQTITENTQRTYSRFLQNPAVVTMEQEI